MNDSQAAYFLPLMCVPTRANFWLISVRPEQTKEFAARHDDNVWSCLLQILGTRTAPSIAHVFSTLAPLSRRSGSCQCCPCPGCRTLVQLGRFPPHDQTTPPTHRCPSTGLELSRKAMMLESLLRMEDGDSPFVRFFYGSPSTHLWEDEVVMAAFGQNRIWPTQSEFGQVIFVTAFGHAFGQN